MIEQLIERTQKINRAKGWYDKPKSLKQLFALVITEITEAIEEVRVGTPAIYFNASEDSKILMVKEGRGFFQTKGIVSIQDIDPGYISGRKPEGELSELADVAIRCFDIAGRHGVKIDLDRTIDITYDENEPLDFYHDVIMFATCPRVTLEIKLSNVLLAVMYLCEKKNYNLIEAVSLKLDFNNTREHRHGGKRY